VAEDGREDALGIGTGEGELVGVANAGGLDLDQHLARLGTFQLNRLDGERLSRLVRDGGANVHGSILPVADAGMWPADAKVR